MTLALGLATAAHAEDKKDRAQEAIAAADAKIQAAQTAGAGTATPGQVARAREILANAREELHQGHKTAAIEDANHAAALAEASIGETQQQVKADASDAVQQARAEAADAHDQVADANARAASADQAAATAAEQARSAQASAAIAQEAATAAAAAPPTPAPAQVTVTTTDRTATTAAPARAKKVTHRVVHRTTGTARVHTTTTTVTQAQ
jgi:hypothetical protein